MKHAITFIALLALAASSASADLYRCKTATGTAYQEKPCTSGGSPVHKAHPLSKTASPTTTAPDKEQAAAPASEVERMRKTVADLEKKRRVERIKEEIATLERANELARVKMENGLAALRAKKATANNNLAGATWENSISSEMQAITAQHTSEIDSNNARIQRLREDLAGLEK